MFVPNLLEAATVHLIETILFGRPLKMPAPVPTTKRQPRRSPRTPSPPVNPFAASNAEFFRCIMLHKRVVKPSCSQVTPVTPAPSAGRSDFTRSTCHSPSPPGPSFPRGLCYLVGVALCDHGAAMLTL